MIEGYFKEICEAEFPELEWSENFYDDKDNTGAVYREAGDPADRYESDLKYPNYMIYVRSTNWDLAERVIEEVANRFNKNYRIDYTAIIDNKTYEYEIIFIEQTSDVQRIGLYEDTRIMEWSVNFRATIRRKSE